MFEKNKSKTVDDFELSNEIDTLKKSVDNLKSIKKKYKELGFISFHANSAIRKLNDLIGELEDIEQ